MGLFDSKTVITVGSVTLPLMEPNEESWKDAVLMAIIEGSPIGYSIVNSVLGGMSFKVNQLRTYAKNHYTLGLPRGMSTTSVIFNDEDVADAISDSLGLEHGAAVDFNITVPLHGQAAALPFLFTERSLDYHTNRIHIYPPSMPQPTTMTYEEYTNCPVFIDNVKLSDLQSVNNIIQITYTITSVVTYTVTPFAQPAEKRTATITSTYTENHIPPDALQSGRTYCIAKYFVLDESGTPSLNQDWWFYDITSGQYPLLSPTYDIDTDQNFLPVVPIRYDNQDMTRDAVQDTDLYITSKKLLSKIKIDIDDLADKINDHPDVAQIDHAYVIFGINLQSTDEVCLAYLTEYFDYLYESSQVGRWAVISDLQTQTVQQEHGYIFDHRGAVAHTGYHVTDYYGTYEALIQGSRGEYTTHTTVINQTVASNITVHGLNIGITFKYITSVLKQGQIGSGKIGSATITGAVYEDDSSYSSLNTDLIGILAKNATVILRHQIHENVYKEVAITGLTHKNFIYGEEASITTAKDVLTDPEEENFLIPIHHGVAAKMSRKQQNLLYQYSLNMVVNSVDIQEVQWYQRSLFQFILIVITVVIAIISGQWYLPKLAAAFGAGAGAFLMFMLQTIIVGFVMQEGFKLVAEKLGPEFAIIIAVVAFALSKNPKFAASFYQGPAMGAAVARTGMPLAQTFMSISQAALKGVDAWIDDELQDISEQYEIYQVESQEKMEKLQKAQDLLKPYDLLATNLIEAQQSRYMSAGNESPTVFYERTVHTGNVGTLVFDVIPNFHDQKLTLPEPESGAFV